MIGRAFPSPRGGLRTHTLGFGIIVRLSYLAVQI